MRAFLDFEASSLARNSYPIEVAWLFEDGSGEAHLIRPQPDWTDWAAASAAIHGISRARLEAEGAPARKVAARLYEALDGHDAYASAPSWDGKWLSVLLRAGELPRHAIRLGDSAAARAEAAAEALRGRVADEALPAAVAAVLAEVDDWLRRQPVAHRAMADAELELAAWREARRLAEMVRAN